MSIGLKYQDYEVSDKDVWTFSSYYRISDERGDRKRRKLLGYTHFWFLYIHIYRGKIRTPKEKFPGRWSVQFQEIDLGLYKNTFTLIPVIISYPQDKHL